MKRAYEFTVLFSPQLTSDEQKQAQEAVVAHVTTVGGTVTKTDVWGRKSTAYAVGKFKEAFYVLFTLELPTEKAQALEQLVRHTPGVIRHLSVLAGKTK
jgi:small subunit ribosomal protein S6